jgi:hypothetical protein
MITPTPDHLQYLGTVQCPSRGVLGDVQLGAGLAVTAEKRVYLGVAPSTVIAAVLPPTFNGPLIELRKLGTLPCQYQHPNGLFWDEQDHALYMSCHNPYDGDPATDPTLSRGRIVNGTLVSDGQWKFANRSDKMSDGGVCALPDGTLGVGFGMYRSIVNSGPASMGLALASFPRPTVGVSPSVTPLLQYPYKSGGVVARMHRPSDYLNLYGDGYPATATPGQTTWSDYGYQCATFIQTDVLSGFVGIVMRGTGKCFYTNTINAEGWRYDWVGYDPTGFGTTNQQPVVDVPFVFPGMKVNGPHADAPPYPIKGVSWEPVNRLLVIRVQGMFGTDAATLADGLLVYRVVDPLQDYLVTQTTTTIRTQLVKAANEADALVVAKSGTWGPSNISQQYEVDQQ